MQVSRHTHHGWKWWKNVKQIRRFFFSDFYDCSDLRINANNMYKKKSGKNRSCANVVVVLFSSWIVIYIKKKHVWVAVVGWLHCANVSTCFWDKKCIFIVVIIVFFVCSEYKCRGFTSFFESRIQIFCICNRFLCVFSFNNRYYTAKCYLVPHKCCMRHQNARKLQEI